MSNSNSNINLISNIGTIEQLNEYLSVSNVKHILWFGATWCKPCHKLEQMLNDICTNNRIEITSERSLDHSSIITSNTSERSKDHSSVLADEQSSSAFKLNIYKIDIDKIDIDLFDPTTKEIISCKLSNKVTKFPTLVILNDNKMKKMIIVWLELIRNI